jgi:hypothetical protein
MIRIALAVIGLTFLASRAFANDLTLKRVMLSSGGIGYFEYTVDVDGDATLGLDVPLSQVDDVLKSLVVFDAAGGVAGVELPGRDNTIQAFGEAPLSPDVLKSPVAYLNALRGTDVTVQGPRPMTGRIISAEPVTETIDSGNTQRVRVTLLGTDGLRQFVLEDADSVQVSDPSLRARIDNALEAMRQNASLTARHLAIRVQGKGTRTVAVGYVAGAPLWKATYRLMLAPRPASTARLQGWATLENQSGVDWKGVALTLQYGNPVSFRQALYRSYFVQRPEVPVEVLGHVLPDIDTRARDMVQMRGATIPSPAPMIAPAGAAAKAQSEAAAERPPMAPPAEPAFANESAEETTFTLARPVDLAAGHSANVPIIDREYPAPRVGLVPFQHVHPLASVRLRNNDSRALPAGVLTLYDTDGGLNFAGDARLGGLPAGESRLLSFAQDLRTGVETKLSPAPNVLMAVSVADGVLHYTSRERHVIRVTLTAPAKEARDLLLEIPKSSADQTVTAEDSKVQVTEQTATSFRIPLSLAAGETRTVTAWLDQPLREEEALVDGKEDVLRMVLGANLLNPAGRTALNRVLDLRRDEARKQAEVARQRELLKDVQDDEDRIRKNLNAVSTGDALRSRLTKALDADETRIEQIRKAIDDARAEADAAHRALTDAITTMRI